MRTSDMDKMNRHIINGDALMWQWGKALPHVAAYREAFRETSVRQAMIEDYRSAYDVDADHDAADRASGLMISCPVMVLWADERDHRARHHARSSARARRLLLDRAALLAPRTAPFGSRGDSWRITQCM